MTNEGVGGRGTEQTGTGTGVGTDADGGNARWRAGLHKPKLKHKNHNVHNSISHIQIQHYIDLVASSSTYQPEAHLQIDKRFKQSFCTLFHLIVSDKQ